jgi:hypothetical protein
MKNLNLATAKAGGYRPTMEYIQLLEGNFYATDATILIKIPFYEVIPRPLFDQLTEKYGAEMYFKGEDWKNSKAAKGCIFKFKPESDLIEISDNKKVIGFLPVFSSLEFSRIGKYPNCEAVLHKPDAQKEPIQELGIDPEILNTIYQVNNKKHIKLTFYGKNHAIRVDFHESEAQGVVMGMLLDKFNK